MKVKCKKCGEVHAGLFAKVLPISQGLFTRASVNNPQYTLMIKAICPLCTVFIKFIKQDEESVAELNRQALAHELSFKLERQVLEKEVESSQLEIDLQKSS